MPLRYTLAALLLLVPAAVQAQTPGSCDLGDARSELSLSDVRAGLYNRGNLFWNGGRSEYTVPKLGGVDAIFAATLWFGGTVGGEPRTAAADYGSWELWPGPLDAGATLPDPTDCTAYDRIWRVDLLQLDAYEAGGAPAADLAEWPVGLGAAAVDAAGMPVVPVSREQTVDLDAGERPVIYGTETAFWVMNDVGNTHGTTGSQPLGIEVRVSAFSAASEEDALRTGTFYRVETINRSAAPIDAFHVGFYVDHDLGDFGDDYIGSDAERSMLYAYNSDNDDEATAGGYGTAPPASGIDVLSGGWGALPYETDAFPIIEQSTVGVYRNLQARWSDDVPLTRGGGGYNPGSSEPVVRWIYDGEPTTRSFWTETDTDVAPGEQPAAPGDRRALVSAAPVTLAPGASHTVDFAVLYARGADHLDSVTELRAASDLVQARYDDGSLFAEGDTPVLLAAPSPVSPTDGELVEGGDAISLEWAAVPGAEGYVVQRSGRADFLSYTTQFTEDLSVFLFPEIADEPVEVYWRVRAEATGAVSPFSEIAAFTYLNLTADFLGQGRGIVEVARPGGAVCPDGSDDYGCVRGLGNTVFRSPDAGADYLVTGSIQNVSQLVRRHVGSAAPGTYEIRFTDTGGVALEGNTFAFPERDRRVLSVPFELWALGTTPDDGSDDLRMIPVVGSPGDGVFNWADAFPRTTPDNDLDFPASAAVNGLMPDRTDGYARFEAAALASGGPGALYIDTDDIVTPIDPGAYLVGDADPRRGGDCANQGYYISFCYRNDQESRVLGAALGSSVVAPISMVVFADMAGDGTTPPPGTVVRFLTTPVGSYVVDAENAADGTVTALLPPFPNPTRGRAEVVVRLRDAGPVRARLVDMLGRQAALLADGAFRAGEHRLAIPSGLAAGAYVITLEADGERFSRTLTVVR